ncbi:MAG TPA: hypothetical protein VNE39_06595 [Planctomycetota bacterium]|nr:hypothetical protein [Planctomycetota bacterium]
MGGLASHRLLTAFPLWGQGVVFTHRGVLVWLLLCGTIACGDIFTNKKDGEAIVGQLLGSVTKDGSEMFIVKTQEGQQRLLAKADWAWQKGKPANPTAPEGSFSWPPVLYEGKPRDAEWLENTYARFKSSVVLIEGKYYDVGGAHLWASAAKPYRMFGEDEFFKEGYVFSVGDSARVVATVFQVLSEDEMLLRLDRLQVWFNKKEAKEKWRATSAPDGQMLRLKGCSTDRLTDGATVEVGPLVAVGTHRYKTAMGGSNTVIDCRRLPAQGEAITRAQFADALNKGLQLVVWTRAQRQVVSPPGNRKVAETYWKRVPVN